MRRFQARPAFFLLGWLFVSAAAHAEPVEQTVEEHRNEVGEIDRRGDQFVHRPSGYIFPATLGEMPARKTYTYGPGDASVYYTLLGGGKGDPWLSLYLYPVTRPLADEIKDVELALVDRMQGSVSRPAGLPALPSGVVQKWYGAAIEGTPVTTGYRLARSGDWYIKVRLTIPTSGGDASFNRAWKALEAVRWMIDAPVAPVQAAAPTSQSR